jgi:hypothetical protein
LGELEAKLMTPSGRGNHMLMSDEAEDGKPLQPLAHKYLLMTRLVIIDASNKGEAKKTLHELHLEWRTEKLSQVYV